MFRPDPGGARLVRTRDNNVAGARIKVVPPRAVEQVTLTDARAPRQAHVLWSMFRLLVHFCLSIGNLAQYPSTTGEPGNNMKPDLKPVANSQQATHGPKRLNLEFRLIHRKSAVG